MTGRRLRRQRRKAPRPEAAPPPVAAFPARPARGERRYLGFHAWEWAALLTLLVIVWGAGALQRGPFQDDTTYLQQMKLRENQGPSTWFSALGRHRPLAVIPAWVAVRTPSPPRTLQVIHGMLWLGQALLAAALARRLLPSWPPAAYVTAAVALCATSDFLTNSPVAIHYNQAATALAGALVLGLDFALRGRWWRVTGAVLLLQVSLWSVDVALPVVLTLPLWIPVFRARDERRRAVAWVAASGVSTLPFAWQFLERLRTDRYAATAVQNISLATWAERTWDHTLVDFSPWRWALERPQWATPIDAPAAPWALLLGGVIGAGVFLVPILVRRSATVAKPRMPGGPSLRWAAVALSGATLAGHIAYSRLHFHHIWYRTHIASRLWVSILIVLITAVWWRRRGQLSLAAPVLPLTFVLFGAAGGLERQDFYSSFWRHHQQELASLARQAPELAPDTIVLLLADPPPKRYLATEVTYLAQAWGHLLWGWGPGVILASPERRTFCHADEVAGEVVCDREICPDAKNCPPFRLPPNRLVVFEYHSPSNEWRLLDTLPSSLRPADQEASYAPGRRVQGSSPSRRQRQFLMLD